LCYNGHKRTHALKFQSLITLDGVLFHVDGPVEARLHDLTLYCWTNMDAKLQRTFQSEGRDICANADSAFLLRAWLKIAFGGVASLEQSKYNTAMSALRASVEWGFKDGKTILGHLDFRWKQKVQEVPVGKLFLVSCFLWNIRCCLYGSPTATFFSCLEPTLDESLADE